MKHLIICLIVLLCVTDIFGQSKRKKQSAVAKPKNGIHSVDFRNFTYDGIGSESERVTLRKGRNLVKGDYSSGTYGTEIGTIKYVDFDGDGKQEALVVLNYSQEAAGSYWEQHYFVFAYRDGRAQQIFHESRYKSYGFRLRGNALVVGSPHWRDDDAHCCPSQFEVATFRWRGNRFVRSSQFKQGCCDQRW
jgi:hypothetical protein